MSWECGYDKCDNRYDGKINMKKSELQKNASLEDYLYCFSPDEDNNNYYLCVSDIMEMLDTYESTTGKNLRRLEKAGKLESVVGNNNRVYYCLKSENK